MFFIYLYNRQYCICCKHLQRILIEYTLSELLNEMYRNKKKHPLVQEILLRNELGPVSPTAFNCRLLHCWNAEITPIIYLPRIHPADAVSRQHTRQSQPPSASGWLWDILSQNRQIRNGSQLDPCLRLLSRMSRLT